MRLWPKLLIFAAMSVSVLAIGGFFIFIRYPWHRVYVEPSEEPPLAQELAVKAPDELPRAAEPGPQITALLEARQKSSDIKGVYLNEFVANLQTPWATAYREKIKTLLDETELNGVVIDIKEAYGPDLPSSLEAFIKELHQKGVWVIARICVFRDSSLKKEKPEWYLKDKTATTSDNIWADAGGVSWLDPAGSAAQQYIVDFSKKAVDLGFDELQFDYVRFPSEGILTNLAYPFYDSNGTTTKHEVIGNFFAKLTRDLRDYKPSIMLSADLFGYVATQYQALDIGQRLFDAGQYFDYLSFMLYPSHFYGGFSVPADWQRQLPALFFPYKDETTTSTDNLVSNNPYNVVFRSVLQAYKYLALFNLQAKIRPWLQDFNLKFDTERGIYYTADKIKEQIKGAQAGGASGWLLWNSANIYTDFY